MCLRFTNNNFPLYFEKKQNQIIGKQYLRNLESFLVYQDVIFFEGMIKFNKVKKALQF